MNSLIQGLRAAGLAAAVLVLPCCRDEVGKGDELSQVTVRVSITSAKVEPNQHCVKPSVSSDGNFIAFESDSTTLAPGDANGFTDIFVRNRLTGEVENITNVVPTGEFPTWAISNCTDPVISGNGKYVAFRSNGNYKKIAQPSGGSPHVYIWVYDRDTGFFKRGYNEALPLPNADMNEPTLSDTGQYLAFSSAATNLTPANPGGTMQIYITDFTDGTATTTTLVSRKLASATPTTGACLSPRVSGNGQFVTFAATFAQPFPNPPLPNDLVNPVPSADQHIYRGTASGGTVTLVSVGADDICYFPVISGDGRYVSFMTRSSLFPSASIPYIVRRDMSGGGTNQLAVEGCAVFGFVFPDGMPFGMSADGEMFSYVAIAPPTGSILNGIIQVFTIDMAGNVQLTSRHLDGRFANLDCLEVAISGDGRWAAWSTSSPNMVDGDGNGVRDVYARGPLR